MRTKRRRNLWCSRRIETLESRRLLAGDIGDLALANANSIRGEVAQDAMAIAEFQTPSPAELSVGGNLNLYAQPILFQGGNLTAPTVGQRFGVRMYWSTEGLASDANYDFSIEVNGFPLDVTDLTIGAGESGQGFYFWTLSGWFAEPGAHTVTITMDPDNRVQETNEDDNVRQILFTSQAPSDLPQKFIFPLDGKQGEDWAIGNYLDVDPRSDSAEDFRGGPYHYNGHPGVDISPANFARLDQGIAVLAMADGVVTEVVDGNTDREFGFSSVSLDANFVKIDHGNNWQVRYFHVMRDSITVQVGDSVSQGDVIASMGSSGASANLIGGPHLHYDVSHNGTLIETHLAPTEYYVDPLPYQADTRPAVLDLAVSNVNAFNSSDGAERIPEVTEFSILDDETAFLTYFLTHLNPGDEVEVHWRRPDGQVAQTKGFTSSSTSRNGTHQWVLDDLVWKQATGTWNIEVLLAGELQAVTSFDVVATPSVPEIRVRQDGDIVLDGRTSAIDFGSTEVGTTGPTMAFVVENQGGSELVLDSMELPVGFSLVGAFPTSVAAKSSAGFTVQLDGTTIGHQFGEIRFNTNDPDESSFDFIIEGTVTGTLPATSPRIDLNQATGVGHFLNDEPVLLQPNADVVDSGSTTNQQATLLVSVVTGAKPGDELSIRALGDDPGEVNVDQNNISYGGINVATIDRINPESMLITFGSASDAAVRDILRSVTWTSADLQSTSSRTIQLVFSDSDGLASEPVYRELVLALPNPAAMVDPLIDLTERNASDWGSFPSEESTVSDSHIAVTAGLRSIHFDTQGPFDTGVVYPATASASWDVTQYESFAMELYSQNATPNGFQGFQPILVLNAPGGSVRLEPNALFTPKNGPASILIPLDGDSTWTRTVTGTPDLTQVNQFEIHQDTWDSDFEIWYDRIRFVEPPKDRGDSPAPYPTLLIHNGASHFSIGPTLGALRDGEYDATPNLLADGDDSIEVDDEDGVLFGGIVPGAIAGINIDLHNATDAKVDAWIDFNSNGIWESSEQILDSALVATGLQTLNYTAPSDAIPGTTYARVRVSSVGGLNPTGSAVDGEVEDYQVTIGAVIDTDSVTINSDQATRSELTEIEVQFDDIAEVLPSDFELRKSTGELVTGIAVQRDDSSGSTLATLTFTADPLVIMGTNPGVMPTLADGVYELKYQPTGQFLIDEFFRKYGDDDASNQVGLADFAAFRTTFGLDVNDAGFNSGLDANRDGEISLIDFAAFRRGFGN